MISVETKDIRIAFATDDGTSTSAHFGRAQYYEVVTISNGVVACRKQREKPSHHAFGHHAENQRGDRDTCSDHERPGKHKAMVVPIADCQIIVSRGMGSRAYDHFAAACIKPVVTNQRLISDALSQIIQGTVDGHPERLH
jgi:predicted Fe-Mo cluster-binding NifX family protein